MIRDSEDTALKSRPRDFTRNGALSPELLITILLEMVGDGGRRGYRHLLEQFWDHAEGRGISLPCDEPVSAAAFCKARRKLKPHAIRSLQHQVADEFGRLSEGRHLFKVRRILAVDGAKLSTQRSPELDGEFGTPSGGHCPQLLLSTLFDVIAEIPIDATVVPFKGSERDELLAMLPRIRKGDVVVLDRGYPSTEVISALIGHGADFVIRMPARSTYNAIETFLEFEGDDCRIILGEHPDSSPNVGQPIEVRAIRTTGEDGDPQVFISSLRRAEFTRTEILHLYRLRWEVELFYRLQKGDYIGHRQFHAKTPEGVRQEIYALHLYVTLTRHLMDDAAQAHGVQYHEISQKGAMLSFAHHLSQLLLVSDEQAADAALARILARIARTREPKRQGRSFPRVSLKPRPRWTPTGRWGSAKQIAAAGG